MGDQARILLADHHTANRARASKTLKSAGYFVEETGTAEEFLRSARTNHHDLILLDDSLPDLDSRDACRKIKDGSLLRCSVGPSVLLLSSAGDEFPKRANPSRVDGFISRSLVGRELIATVNSMIQLRKAENATVENDLYRQLVENLHQGIWAIDKDGYTTFMNERMAAMLMTTSTAALGKHLFDFMDERGVEICKLNLGRREQGISEDHDFELIRSDGSRVYTIMQTSPVTNPAGEYIGALAGVLDITDRVAAESGGRHRAVTQIHQLLESTPDAMVVADRTGKIILVNAGTERIFGYPRKELLGRFTEILVPEDQRKAHRQVRGRFIANHGPRINGEGFEMSGLKKDGTVFPAEVSLSPLHNVDGLQFVSTIRDITRRKNVERRMQANLNAQQVIGAILHLSLEPITLVDFLQQTLEMILDLPWLSLMKKGAVFLVEDE
ncbi:MAG: PAS domain S-box protein, partial [Candidatus Krumholzibacteriota bacterium]